MLCATPRPRYSPSAPRTRGVRLPPKRGRTGIALLGLALVALRCHVRTCPSFCAGYRHRSGCERRPTRASDDRNGRHASVSPDAHSVLAFGVEAAAATSGPGRLPQPDCLDPVLARYADLAPGFATSRGHLATDIGMTTRSALITRRQLSLSIGGVKWATRSPAHDARAAPTTRARRGPRCARLDRGG
jgi:hypothetical protein